MNIAVCLPTLNEELNLPNLLHSLANQNRLPNEIIIVDAGSTDNTITAAQKYMKWKDLYIRLFLARGSTIGAGRHYATMKATSDIIVSTDADVMFPHDYLERVEYIFQNDKELIAIWGPVQDSVTESLFSSLLSAQFKGIGCNTSFRKSAYLKTIENSDKGPKKPSPLNIAIRKTFSGRKILSG